MPARPSASAAATENSAENLASSPVRGSGWIRILGTVAWTPTVTSATWSGSIPCTRLSSRAPSMMEWVQAHEG